MSHIALACSPGLGLCVTQVVGAFALRGFHLGSESPGPEAGTPVHWRPSLGALVPWLGLDFFLAGGAANVLAPELNKTKIAYK